MIAREPISSAKMSLAPRRRRCLATSAIAVHYSPFNFIAIPLDWKLQHVFSNH